MNWVLNESEGADELMPSMLLRFAAAPANEEDEDEVCEAPSPNLLQRLFGFGTREGQVTKNVPCVWCSHWGARRLSLARCPSMFEATQQPPPAGY